VQCYFKEIIHFPDLFMYRCAAVTLACFKQFSFRRLQTKRVKMDSNHQLHICKVQKSSSVGQKKEIAGDYTRV